MERSKKTLVQWAIAIGGTSALLHLVHHLDTSHPVASRITASGVVAQSLLYAVPIFLGILAGLWTHQPIRNALQISGVALLTAAPLMLEDLICLIVILPFCLVVAPLCSWLAWRFFGPGSGRSGGSRWPQNLLLLILPFACVLSESFVPSSAPSSVQLVDQVVLQVDRRELWQSLEYLELRFDKPAPTFLRALLPVPQAVSGGGSHVGAERRVQFSNGVAVGTVVAMRAPEWLSFRVEVIPGGTSFFDHWVRLEHSELELEDIGAGRTRLTHRTRYLPLSQPRWYFEPVERVLGSYVQAYMLRAYAESLTQSAESVGPSVAVR